MSHQLLIKDCSLVTFFNDGYNAIKILENIDLLVEDGTIRTMDRNIEADCETIDAEGKLAVPGFVNGRSRCLASKMTKAIAEDLKFDLYGNTPLYTRVNPFLNIALEILDDEQLEGLLALALYEAIDSGTTTLFEHCSLRELPIFLAQCEKAGIRTVAAPMLMDRYTFPTADAWGIFDDGLEPVDEDGIIAENVRLVEQYMHNERVRAIIGLGSADTVKESLLRKAAEKAARLECGLMVPLNETLHEREVCQTRWGLLPTEFLHKNHVLHRYTLAGGNQYTSHADRVILKHTDTQAVICPLQSMLDAQTSPFIDFLIDDVPTIVGSGRCSVDMTQHIFAAVVNGKLESGKRYQMRAQDAFYAVTVGGGRAMQMPIGELEVGCKADIILIDLHSPKFNPLAMPVKELVYNLRAEDVSDVIIQGEIRKRNGRVLGADPEKLVKDAEAAMDLVWKQARTTGVL